MPDYQCTDPGRWSHIASSTRPPNSSPIGIGGLRVQELPPELVTKIIRFFLDDLPNVTLLPLDTGSRHPRLQITQVCAGWRAIAFGIHDLWELAVPGNGSFHGSYSLASSWLHRIAGPRLSLAVMVDDILDKPQSGVRGDFLIPLEDLVVPYGHRLRKLSIPVTANGLKKLLRLSANSFSNLEILHLQLVGSNLPVVDTTSSPFITAPLLRELFLTLDNELQMKTHFPWAQLTTISISGRRLDAADCLSILSNGVSITSLTLSHISAIDSETESRILALQSQSLYLPNIKRLKLGFSCSNPNPLLRSLELPNLAHLTLGSSRMFLPWARGLRHFFESFAQHLESFEINNSCMFVEMDDEVLSWMPNLHSLNLRRDYRLTPATLQRIGAGELLPKAEHLEFCARDVAHVVKMLSERQRRSQVLEGSLTAIKKIKVYARMWLIDDDYWKLRAQGVEIRLVRI